MNKISSKSKGAWRAILLTPILLSLQKEAIAASWALSISDAGWVAVLPADANQLKIWRRDGIEVVPKHETLQPLEISFDASGEGLLVALGGGEGQARRGELLQIDLIRGRSRKIAEALSIGSPRQISPTSYAFLGAGRDSISGRAVFQWMSISETETRPLSVDLFGYRFSQAFIANGAVHFYYAERGSRTNALHTAPKSARAKIPQWVNAWLGEHVEMVGCDRNFVSCYFVERFAIAGSASYQHRLSVRTARTICVPAIETSWLDSVDISDNGEWLAIVGGKDSLPRSPRVVQKVLIGNRACKVAGKISI